MTRLAVILFAAATLAAVPAAAADPSGDYRGSFDESGRPVPVLLRLEAGAKPGETAGRIRIQEPWACGFDLQFSGTSGDAVVYSFRGAGAGRCAPYSQGFARIRPSGLGIDVQLLRKDSSAGPKLFLAPMTQGN